MESTPEPSERQDFLGLVLTEWNSAEKDIKLAEQVNGEVVIPAINELRYAGRRLIDVIYAYHTDPADREKANPYYQDAVFFCHRARHDAIDATVAHIISQIDNMMTRLGEDVVVSSFAKLSELRLCLRNTQANIVASRKDRENRGAIYKTISDCDFPNLVNLYDELRISEELMVKVAKSRRIESLRNRIFGYGGIAIAVLAWTMPDLPKDVWRHVHQLGEPPKSAAVTSTPPSGTGVNPSNKKPSNGNNK
jgi:hypothetical protein